MQDLTVEGARLVVLRQRVTDRPNAGGKKLLEVPGYKFQALRTNLPSALSALEVWRRYNGRADIENRIKELGTQFGLKGLCCRSFWATEALRRRLFACAAVFSHAAGKPTLKLAVPTAKRRHWWRVLLHQMAAPDDCYAVAALSARAGPHQLIWPSIA